MFINPLHPLYLLLLITGEAQETDERLEKEDGKKIASHSVVYFGFINGPSRGNIIITAISSHNTTLLRDQTTPFVNVFYSETHIGRNFIFGTNYI